MKTAAIIVAAGRGRRMDSSIPKVLLPLAGRTVLARSARTFLLHPGIDEVVIVVADETAARLTLGTDARRVRLVAGGERRQDSVANGLAAAAGADIVLVHDAARPLVDASLIDKVIAAADRYGAAVPIIRIAATVKRLRDDGFVDGTVPRENLALAQTPQGFRTKLLLRAFEHAPAGREATDDAALVESLGVVVRVVEGSPRNIKITVPDDLKLAEALLAGSARPEDLDE